MKYNTGQIIFFSPTKSTLKVVEAVAEGMGFDSVTRTDLTFPVESESVKSIGEVVIVGVPVYAGRVPNLAVERLRQYIQGEGRPVVLVTVYGNRAYEDALLELRNLTDELGFVPCAAGAFIAQHSYSSSELPVAPDVQTTRTSIRLIFLVLRFAIKYKLLQRWDSLILWKFPVTPPPRWHAAIHVQPGYR